MPRHGTLTKAPRGGPGVGIFSQTSASWVPAGTVVADGVRSTEKASCRRGTAPSASERVSAASKRCSVTILQKSARLARRPPPRFGFGLEVHLVGLCRLT